MQFVRQTMLLLALAACAAEGGGDSTVRFDAVGASAGASGWGVAGTTIAGGTAAGGSGGAFMAAAGMASAGSPGLPGSAGTFSAAGQGGQSSGGSGGTAQSGGGGGQGGAVMSAGAGGQPATAGTTGGTAAGMVTIEFTTATYSGRYAPANYGAVWFETPSGMFIKTAKRWAGTIHASDLATWTAASGGWGSIFGGGNMADMMDAMSSATLRSHQSHTVMWNLKDANKQLLPDGEYVAVVEMTEDRAADRKGPVARIPFVKGPSPQMVEAPAVETITGIVLRYSPQ